MVWGQGRGGVGIELRLRVRVVLRTWRGCRVRAQVRIKMMNVGGLWPKRRAPSNWIHDVHGGCWREKGGWSIGECRGGIRAGFAAFNLLRRRSPHSPLHNSARFLPPIPRGRPPPAHTDNRSRTSSDNWCGRTHTWPTKGIGRRGRAPGAQWGFLWV